MGKDAQPSPSEIERRLSYCEINANGSNDLRLGAGAPEEILSLPDEVTNIRFFMLEPLEGPWLRARWCRGEIDETGKLTTYPFAHASQDAGAWGGFFLPLMHLTARISQGIVVTCPPFSGPS